MTLISFPQEEILTPCLIRVQGHSWGPGSHSSTQDLAGQLSKSESIRSQRVQVPQYDDIASQQPVQVQYLGPNTSTFGYLDTLGLFGALKQA